MTAADSFADIISLKLIMKKVSEAPSNLRPGNYEDLKLLYVHHNLPHLVYVVHWLQFQEYVVRERMLFHFNPEDHKAPLIYLRSW